MHIRTAVNWGFPLAKNAEWSVTCLLWLCKFTHKLGERPPRWHGYLQLFWGDQYKRGASGHCINRIPGTRSNRSHLIELDRLVREMNEQFGLFPVRTMPGPHRSDLAHLYVREWRASLTPPNHDKIDDAGPRLIKLFLPEAHSSQKGTRGMRYSPSFVLAA